MSWDLRYLYGQESIKYLLIFFTMYFSSSSHKNDMFACRFSMKHDGFVFSSEHSSFRNASVLPIKNWYNHISRLEPQINEETRQDQYLQTVHTYSAESQCEKKGIRRKRRRGSSLANITAAKRKESPRISLFIRDAMLRDAIILIALAALSLSLAHTADGFRLDSAGRLDKRSFRLFSFSRDI